MLIPIKKKYFGMPQQKGHPRQSPNLKDAIVVTI